VKPGSWTVLGCERTFVVVEIEWEWQRLGRFRGLVGGLVVAQVALVSDGGGADPGWIVYLTGRSQALDGRHPTEFDAMSAAEAALLPPAGTSSGSSQVSRSNKAPEPDGLSTMRTRRKPRRL
jgi:hypothetical protein